MPGCSTRDLQRSRRHSDHPTQDEQARSDVLRSIAHYFHTRARLMSSLSSDGPLAYSPNNPLQALMTFLLADPRNLPGENSRSIKFRARTNSSLNRLARFAINAVKIHWRRFPRSLARSIHFCVWTAITGSASVARTTQHPSNRNRRARAIGHPTQNRAASTVARRRVHHNG